MFIPLLVGNLSLLKHLLGSVDNSACFGKVSDLKMKSGKLLLSLLAALMHYK